MLCVDTRKRIVNVASDDLARCSSLRLVLDPLTRVLGMLQLQVWIIGVDRWVQNCLALWVWIALVFCYRVLNVKTLRTGRTAELGVEIA